MNTSLRVLLCTLDAILLVGSDQLPSSAEDWPVWQHDIRRTGATGDQPDLETLQLRWSWRSASPPQTAWHGPAKYDAYAYHRNLPSMRNYDSVFQVISVGDRVWFGSSVDDTLYCLNADDGTEHWAVTTGGPVRLAATWSNGRVYFGSDDGHARCVDAATGELLWKLKPSPSSDLILNNGRFIPLHPCRTGVVVEGGTAWFGCSMLPWEASFLCAVDAESGQQSSEDHYVRELPGLTIEGAPAVSSSALILPQGRVAPRVFSKETGEDLGEMQKSGGGSIVVVSLDETVFHGPGTDSRKGGFRQSSEQTREMVAGLGRGNAIVVDGSTSWMLTDDEIVCSRLTDQKVLWRASCDCPFAMIKAGDVLFTGGDQRVSGWSATDGRLLWRSATEGRIFGLAAANGRLFCSSDSGTVQCFAAGQKKPDQTDPSLSERQQNVLSPVGDTSDLKMIDEPGLIHHWAFQSSSVKNQTIDALKGADIVFAKTPWISRLGDHQSIELDGREQTLMVNADFRNATVPQRSFTAAAMVRLDQYQEWGGIVGVIQDDGDLERGWLLGYRKDRFCVGLCAQDGPQRLTYLSDIQPFERERWYYVVGSYDGQTMRLYVDGQLKAEGTQQAGDIHYPDRAWFEIGAYHDKDEYFRMVGALHEMRIYDRALTAEEVAVLYDECSIRIPAHKKMLELATSPCLKFIDPSTAIVQWRTQEPEPTIVEWGMDQFNTTWHDEELVCNHEVTLTGLRHKGFYQYRIGQPQAGDVLFSAPFECDNFFNYTLQSPGRSLPLSSDDKTKEFVERIQSLATTRTGLCLIVGRCETDRLIELCRATRFRFVIAETDSDRTRRDVAKLRRVGLYGSQVTIHQVEDLSRLPFVDGWANIVLVDQPADESLLRECQRLVRPNGGVLILTKTGEGARSDVRSQADVRSRAAAEMALEDVGVGWKRYLRPPLTGSADWSHLYGTPDNSGFAGEQLGNARSTQDLGVQWIGRPGPRYQADRSGRKPSPLSAGGRLFLQGLHRVLALDVFNGTVIWSLEIPGLERFNMPRDCSNWCASDKYLFLAVQGECWQIDAATGEIVRHIPAPAVGENAMEWGYIATADDQLFGTSVKPGTAWTTFWGDADAGWYDARSGEVTFPVCSDLLTCRDTETSDVQWEYRGGVILNSTITISNGVVYLVESRDPDVIASGERRIGDSRLWKSLRLVAIDAESGSLNWVKPLDPMDPQVVLYLAHAGNQLTLVSSHNGLYQVSSRSDDGGQQLWKQTVSWPGGKGDHGKAMMRPGIVGNRIFLRPHVLSLNDGSLRDEVLPEGHGCGTYACTTDAVFYRAETVTMWSPDASLTTRWPRLRPDCWLSTIPACGMLLSPEGGGGCSCGSWMETSIGFMPRSHKLTRPTSTANP